jgi:hypothetical protein
MRKRGASLPYAGDKASSALGDAAATQGLSFWPRPAGVPRRPLALAVGIVLLGAAVGFAACGGGGGDEGEASPTATTPGTLTATAAATLTAEEAKQAAAIPNVENPDTSQTEVVSQEALSPDDVQSEVTADPQLADLMAYAQEQGYGSVTGGVTTEYGNGVVVTAGALQSPDNELVAVVRSSEPYEDYFLIRLERGDPLKLVVFDKNGKAALDLITREVTSSDAHAGCRYFHCVAAAIFFLMDDPTYGRIVGRACGSCLGGLAASQQTLPDSCPACIATALAPVLASASVCSEDACGWCYDDSCGGVEVVDRICAMDPASFNPAVLERSNHYHCDNPHRSNSRCNSELVLKAVEECPLGCAGSVCATTPPPPGPCDPATCEEEVSTGEPVCVFRPDDSNYVVTQDFQQYSCQPMAAGGYGCRSEEITRVIEVCPNGCAADGKSCAGALQTCDPALCTKEEPVGDPRCVASPSGYIVEQPFDDYSCQDLSTGGSACLPRSATEVMENCPNGCAPDGKSCASASGVPVAPSDFLALQHQGGTEFQWTDNSLNEDGFRIYFGARSLGRPSQLITTVGPDAQTVDTDFVRSGSEICWEVYAFNSAGDSAPASYCLPP